MVKTYGLEDVFRCLTGEYSPAEVEEIRRDFQRQGRSWEVEAEEDRQEVKR